VELSELVMPQEETAERFAQVRKLFLALLGTWKTTLLAVLVMTYSWHERFWTDPVMRFTCPMLLFLLSLPVLGYYDVSFVRMIRKRKDSARR